MKRQDHLAWTHNIARSSGRLGGQLIFPKVFGVWKFHVAWWHHKNYVHTLTWIQEIDWVNIFSTTSWLQADTEDQWQYRDILWCRTSYSLVLNTSTHQSKGIICSQAAG